MAKLKHTFVMSSPPQQAKAAFQADIGPELRRRGEFRLERDRPGSLLYSDGDVPLDPMSGNAATGDWNTYAGLRKLLARRITVEFAGEGAGTRVSVRGRAERDICAAICELGLPGHWPENQARVQKAREAEGYVGEGSG